MGKKEKTLTRAFWVVDNLHINVKVMFVCFLLLSFFFIVYVIYNHRNIEEIMILFIIHMVLSAAIE